ncbi:hypothetical protein BMETH_1057_0 [methanotrophic bacterial endosymbiont of Bathymodiolus sp.]|nr:hypothetical protein BMETH_1057_0 [methanotrophic bacterial endosymbiont of Bathymodiolus sp.]
MTRRKSLQAFRTVWKCCPRGLKSNANRQRLTRGSGNARRGWPSLAVMSWKDKFASTASSTTRRYKPQGCREKRMSYDGFMVLAVGFVAVCFCLGFIAGNTR